MIASLIGALLAGVLTPAQMQDFGWRIPLLIGCAIVPLILWLRTSLQETEAFAKMEHKAKSASEIFRVLGANWQIVLIGAAMSVLTTTTFYLITAYTPTYGRAALHLDIFGVLLVTLCVGISNFIWLPIGGALSDRIGRYPLLFLIPIATILTAYPALLWLVGSASLGKLLAVVLLFSAYFGLYNGAMIPLLAEIMPPQVRISGFSLAFSLATAIFGGFTPLVSTYLIELTGDRASPGFWLSFAAVISLLGVIFSRRVKDVPNPSSLLG